MTHVLERAPDGGRRDALVLRQILVGDVITDLEVDPLRKSPAHPTAGPDPNAVRVELPQTDQIEHGLALQEGPSAGQRCGCCRLRQLGGGDIAMHVHAVDVGP